jgi:WD40 repeat protein
MTAVALCLLAHSVAAHARDKQPEPAVLKKHAKAVRAVAFSPDGKTLAACADDGAICRWSDVGILMSFSSLRHRKLVSANI